VYFTATPFLLPWREVLIVIMIVLGVAMWLSIPALLSRAMRRRGYDRASWRAVGLLLGPVGAALAALKMLFGGPERARILDAGLTGPGDLSILVVLDGRSPTPPPTAALAELSPHLRRLGLAQILPKRGRRLDARRANHTLRRAAIGLAQPELALLFGRPEVAIADHAVASGYDVVVTAHPDSLVSARLTAIGRVHWWGNDEVPVFGPGRVTAVPSASAGTESRSPAPHRIGSAGPADCMTAAQRNL
jgi:hypothetical protein